MALDQGGPVTKTFFALRTAVMGPQILVFLPALMLGGFWYGGEGFLMYLALLFPALFAVSGLLSDSISDNRDGVTGLHLERRAIRTLDQFLAEEARTGMTTAALAISLDDFQPVERQFGQKAAATILMQAAERIQQTLRDTDLTARLDDGGFGVILSPMRRSDLEVLIQLSARIQATIAEPFSIDATRVYVTASVGFCTPARAPVRSGTSVLASAKAALQAAKQNGSGTIRAFSPETKRKADTKNTLHSEIAQALENGEIIPWFQPQVSTDTGRITGFEALARWEHPEHGTLGSSDFVESITDLGLSGRLSEIMLYQSLVALREWDRADQHVPAVSVNFSNGELRDPKLVDKIRWELDRFELAPDRLCVEILEDVVADASDDTTTRNIAELAKLGCHIDLDDFGTGHASIANIKRFAVDRIKIDRSFVTRVDRDREQQNMVAAVLTMAERLGLRTLAEGVETVGEHAMLAQLGCGHVQGFSVARPMKFSETIDWLSQHSAKVADTADIGRRAV